MRDRSDDHSHYENTLYHEATSHSINTLTFYIRVELNVVTLISPTERFLVPAIALQLVYQKPWYVPSILLQRSFHLYVITFLVYRFPLQVCYKQIPLLIADLISCWGVVKHSFIHSGSSQCSTTYVTMAVVCIIMSVG